MMEVAHLEMYCCISKVVCIPVRYQLKGSDNKFKLTGGLTVKIPENLTIQQLSQSLAEKTSRRSS